ncbi:hypothetical protein ACHAWF_007224 [Thalassiosira exigua]
MKQAYTNTIRGGSRTPLTIATGSKKGRGGKQLPKCAYGAACTRKGCAYWHPPPSAAPFESYHDDPRSKICKPFLAGLCSYGNRCMNRHPAREEADAVRAAYKEKSCSYGDDCQTEGCLYYHPWEAAEVVGDADYSEENICTAMGGLQVASAPTAGVPTYEQWLALNCPPPPTMDENYVYNVWHYPGSGMQRSPWEVYGLMYPQQFNNTATAGANGSAASHTWGATASHVNAAPQAPMSVNEPPKQDPKTFQDWKRQGQPYPSWFCSDLDPWYDDDGRRLELEEVYEVLYGENAEENFAKKQRELQAESDPTPAELAAVLSTNGNPQGASAVHHTTSTGGWASIAAKRPASNQNQYQEYSDSGNGSRTGNQSAAWGYSSTNTEQKRHSVIIPKEVWLPSTANSDCFHLYPNPIERFNAVNSHHKPYLASVTIPTCFEGSNPDYEKPSKGGKVAVLDVHFQSAKTITPVLNRFLTPALKKNDEVWIVTGSGSHVAAGHQRRESGGVLFNAVKRYLQEREDEMALEFRVGKDTSSGRNKISGGAFLVRKLSREKNS